ncbi:hypothetical protein EVAR_52603_1 [Eumeta japonica]|uniref:Uncharacterized protein n=1 Tax=Eumeta variegata TaxID=151549 RepID=A0A4C1YPV2_EUMVA|nr:hypothetical protein EVAR_52603_1 [Eumeta japonica]
MSFNNHPAGLAPAGEVRGGRPRGAVRTGTPPADVLRREASAHLISIQPILMICPCSGNKLTDRKEDVVVAIRQLQWVCDLLPDWLKSDERWVFRGVAGAARHRRARPGGRASAHRWGSGRALFAPSVVNDKVIRRPFCADQLVRIDEAVMLEQSKVHCQKILLSNPVYSTTHETLTL